MYPSAVSDKGYMHSASLRLCHTQIRPSPHSCLTLISRTPEFLIWFLSSEKEAARASALLVLSECMSAILERL